MTDGDAAIDGLSISAWLAITFHLRRPKFAVGQRVVARAAAFPRPGDRVRPVPEAAAASTGG
jgi:hypothetical protein